MENIFIIWAECDDIEPYVIAVSDTREQAEKIIQKSKDVFEDAFEYRIDVIKKNTIIINDVKYTF